MKNVNVTILEYPAGKYMRVSDTEWYWYDRELLAWMLMAYTKAIEREYRKEIYDKVK